MEEYLRELLNFELMNEVIIKSGVTICRTEEGDLELENSFEYSGVKVFS